ncbi:MAG: hypothetical protein HY043_02580 [Verrucomicrobia bacterium]|nr:hypothetical protein [Verrucomicrobiota bacterium]
MKAILILALALALSVVNSRGQANQAEVSNQTQIPAKKKSAPALLAPDSPALRAVPRKVIFGGALVRLAKTDKPLQLINPFAPARYGSGLNDLVVDPATGKALGISLLSIRN